MSHACVSTSLSARALARCLNELAALIDRTPDLDYVAKPRGGVSGSIGAHVRHCLDHVNAVLDPTADGVVSYDHRRRQTAIEEHRVVAAAALRASAERLEGLAAATPDAPLTLEAQVDRDGRCVLVRSSMARELVFVLQHTIHHQALVALLLAERGVPVPRTFGYAPSTPRSAA
jgi:uncharacterized damage-inducible protein DinB